jgi:DNA-binding response OmpR family regulator
MDVQMPIVDGLEATQQIRALEHERGLAPTPIIALTANARASDVEKSRAAGCTAHLTKPISKRALLSAIEAAVPAAAPSIDVDVPEGLEELADEYLQARRQELPEFQQSLQRRDFDRLRVMGHNLAGSGESYGFPPLSRFGKSLEDAARARDLATADRHIRNIQDYLDRVSLARPE